MAQEKTESKNKIKRNNETVKHVQLERKRPKLSKVNNSKSAGNQNKKNNQNRKNSTRSMRDPKAVMKIIPLGGLDAIGKNMTVFECKNDMVLDDAGLMFPDDDHPGIDLILPDYTYVLENAEKLRGIVITHGHEDHTGSLPYLLKDLDRQVPIYGTKLTLGLIEGKLKEHKIKNAKLCEIKPGQTINLGCIKAEFFAVNHSIPGAVGVFFRSPAGNVLHTGDFKLDQSPIDGVQTDFAALARFSKEGVDLMLSDSTNATNPNFTPSEAEVGKALDSIISGAKGRVIVASFASHIHRMQQICDAAVKNGRKVAVTGRSMVQNTDIARRLGYLNISDKDIIDAYDLKGMPPDTYVIMCTGSQGEPLSALARIANGDHKTISIEEGDTVIISATPVPGNEKAVTRVVNSLAKIGADVYDKSRACVHVSGHAGAEELKLILSIVRPAAFLPVHGEATHLRAHANLAQAIGVAKKNIFILENGESIELSSKGVKLGKPVPSGIVLVDGLSVGDTSEIVLHERSSLGAQGVASIACAISKHQLISSVQVEMRGIPGGDDPDLVTAVENAVSSAVKRSLSKQEAYSETKKIARSALLSVLWERTNQRPLVIVNILDL
jgi:ribonuclease J